MRHVTMLRQEQDGMSHARIHLLHSATRSEQVGSISARIFPDSGYFQIQRLTVAACAPPNTATSDTLMKLLKAAEGEAFSNGCTTIYGTALGDVQAEAFKQMGYQLCPYALLTDDMDNEKGSPVVLEASYRDTPLALICIHGPTQDPPRRLRQDKQFLQQPRSPSGIGPDGLKGE